jgi:hypothetical protein
MHQFKLTKQHARMQERRLAVIMPTIVNPLPFLKNYK